MAYTASVEFTKNVIFDISTIVRVFFHRNINSVVFAVCFNLVCNMSGNRNSDKEFRHCNLNST